MDKEMEKEKNIIMKENYYLKVNIKKDLSGMGKAMIKMGILSLI